MRFLRVGIELAVQRIVIARWIGLSIGIGKRRLVVIRLWRGTLRRIAVQRMHRTRVILGVILLWDFLPGALHPRRWTRGRLVIRRRRLLVLSARAGARLDLLIGPTHAERVGLTDQPRQFGQRIALGLGRCALLIVAIMVIIGGKRSVLISISHRDDASPSGKPPTHPFKRTGPRQLPPRFPR